MKNENFENGRQIRKIQTAKKCLAIYDELNPCTTANYAELHANGSEGADGKKMYSRIKFQILDYSNGTGDKTKKAEFNLTPEQLLYIKDAVERELSVWKLVQTLLPALCKQDAADNMLIKMVNYVKPCFQNQQNLDEVTQPLDPVQAMQNFEYRQDKIIAASVDANGRSPMTRFSIARTPFAADGKPMNSPWRISIDKGSAIAQKNANGGSYAKSGTFVSDNGGALTFNASDEDFLTSLIKVAQTINVFETVVCGVTYKRGKLEEQERRTNAANQGYVGNR